MPESPAASSLPAPGPARPLLSITIPTFNRAPFLDELLHSLAPALPADGSVELVLSDNSSTDNTPAVIERFAATLPAGLVRSHRHPHNVGSDTNFLTCLSLARGTYAWILGDDDILLPNAIPSLLSLLQQCERTGGVDLVYLSSTGFTGTFTQPPSSATHDRLGRFAEIVTDRPYLLEKVNALIGLISVVLVNRDQLLAAPHPPFESLRGTNLMQLGWILPLLHRRCRVLYVWQRLVAYRQFNSKDWGFAEVFGVRLPRIARDRAEPALARALTNGVLRYWLPDVLFAARQGLEPGMVAEDVPALLRPLHHRNWRFWLFVCPVARLPLPAARVAHRALRTLNKLTRALQALWRHRFRRGEHLRPAPPAL